MPTCNSIQVSKIERNRLDAEYYLPVYLDILNTLKKQPCDKLGDISHIASGSTPPDREFDLKEGILLLKTVNIRDGFIDLERPFYIDARLDETLKNTRLQHNDILVNIVGATLDVIGRVSIIPYDFPRANITQAMALSRIENKNYLPEYVFAFLLSKYGRLQISRLARPTGQYNMNNKEMKEIIIPTLSKDLQNHIAQKVRTVEVLFSKSMKSYCEAEKYLYSYFKLENYMSDNSLTYEASYNDLIEPNRIDAEYYHPKYDKLIKMITKNVETKPLGDIVLLSKGVEVGSEAYADQGIPFIRVSNLTKFGLNDDNQQYISKEMYEHLKTEFKPKVGEILISKDATPGIALVVREEKEQIISGGILHAKPKIKIDEEYLAFIINSLVVQSQIQREVSGSIIIHWRPDLIEKALIPILPKTDQERIGSYVRESLDQRQKAKQLLLEIKIDVEDYVNRLAIKHGLSPR